MSSQNKSKSGGGPTATGGSANKGAQSGAAAAAGGVDNNVNDPKKKPPKGHRQKGAGTVVVSKGEVKRQGLEIKEWQQTPKQLLMNYCRSEKRPMPIYSAAPGASSGKFVARVTLPDPKNQRDKDMVFVPQDASFDSMVEAEHAAALLALHKVDGARSHELKLPEPYKTAWLKLVGRAGPSTASSSASATATPDPFTCEECGKGFSKAHGLETHKKTAHPKAKRGVVDSSSTTTTAANENLASSTTARTVTPSPAPSPSPSPAPPAAVSATSTATIAPVTVGSNANTTASSSAESKNKASGGGVLELKATSAFVTKHEQRAHEERQRIARERRERQRRLEENEDEDYVFMSEENRIEVEAIVREAANQHQPHHYKHHDRMDADLPADAKKTLNVLVYKMGFQKSDARSAVHNGGSTLEAALDWLLVHVDEDRLPAGFDPRSMQLGFIANNNATPAAVDNGKTTEQEISKAKRPFPPKHAKDEAYLAWFESEMGIVLNLGSPDSAEEEWREEWGALEVTLQDEAQLVDEGPSVSPTVRYRLNLGDLTGDRSNNNHFTLHIIIPRWTYPSASSALAFVTGPTLTEEDQWALASYLTSQAKAKEGVAVGYDLWDIAKSRTLKDLLKDALASLNKPSVTGAPPSLPLLVSASDTDSISTGFQQISTGGVASTANSGGREHQQQRREYQRPAIGDKTRQKQSEELFQKLQSRRTKERKPLPAHKFRNEIIQAVDKSRVTIIKGETGCGKTTQVPQFIFDSLVEKKAGGFASIIVTQPRRLAAVSVAMRVAEEMGEEIGGVVGYRVQLEAKSHPVNTRVEFVTTGILLRRMQSDSTLKDVSHVIVDEVHERSLDSDFLLALLRETLAVNPRLKVVLMSATMDGQRFADYFGGAPILEIPGFTFPVKDFYLEDVLAKPACARWKDRFERENASPIEKLEANLDAQFVAACVRQCHSEIDSDGSILVFTSGVAEISSIIRACDAELGESVILLPLHGALTGQDQRRVFERPPRGKRKVIVSTNVAETSVTIDDVVCVIDTGRMKEVRFDPLSKMSSLVDTWVSQANARQRRGRAGRVREGTCLKLFSRNRKLQPDQLAEVHRVPLEQCVLQVASMELPIGVDKFFDSLVDPPAHTSVQAALTSLTDIGALEATFPWRLTPLGAHLSRLPMDAKLGKMLIFGSLLGVPESAAVIAAALSRRSPFLTPLPEKRDEAKAARKALANQGVARAGQSDHLVLIPALDGWRACKSEKDRRKYCSDNFLSDEGMREVSRLQKEFLDALQKAGFETYDETINSEGLLDSDVQKRRLLKACLCAGLYPNVVKIRRPEKRYVETLGGALEAATNAKELAFELLGGGGTNNNNNNNTEETHKSHKRVFLHPTSVNFELGNFNSSWMVYSEIVQTTKAFVRDCTVIAPYGLLLFGGPLSVRHEEGIITSGASMRFKMTPRTAVLVKELKKLLDAFLREKLADPNMDTDDSRILDACKRLIVGNGFF